MCFTRQDTRTTPTASCCRTGCSPATRSSSEARVEPDFQNGDPRAQYESIFGKLLKLPDATLLYPAHDYKGDTVSTIGEEKAFNPRLQVRSVDQYAELMNNLN